VTDTRLHVLMLQHPQEPDKLLGTARLAHLALPNSTLRIGLSWRNLASALGREAVPSRWAVLYLGSGAKDVTAGHPVTFVNKKGEALAQAEAEKIQGELEGFIVLDGTWTQAKALWWRNPWLLKLRRIVLNPAEGSLYRELRREPRSECVSTVESIALALTGLGEPVQSAQKLIAPFESLLSRYRESGARPATQKPRGARRRPPRRKSSRRPKRG
jgi:DTW domain-containing protein YfiP